MGCYLGSEPRAGVCDDDLCPPWAATHRAFDPTLIFRLLDHRVDRIGDDIIEDLAQLIPVGPGKGGCRVLETHVDTVLTGCAGMRIEKVSTQLAQINTPL